MRGVFFSTVQWRKGLPRRVEILQGERRVVLKVAKDLRPRFAKIALGVELTLHGTAETRGDRVKRKITALGSPALPPASTPEMVVQVCAKKHCWNKGGSEVYRQLQDRIAEKGLEHVRLEKTGCLGNCRHCPSARLPLSDEIFGRVDENKLEQLLPARAEG